MKQWLGVGDPERRPKSENEGPRRGAKVQVFESQNQEPKSEDK